MEVVLYTATFRPRGGCIRLLKLRFFVSISMLCMSSMTGTVSSHGVGLLSNPPLDSQIFQQLVREALNQDTHSKRQIPSPHPSPQGSPSNSPSPIPGYSISANGNPPPHKEKKPHPPPNPRSNIHRTSNTQRKDSSLNTGQMSGLVLLSIAGLLQVVVVTYLLVKRKQMMQVVEKYEV